MSQTARVRSLPTHPAIKIPRRGVEALYSNTIGTENVADGNRALYDNTSGTDNLAIGPHALDNNTAGVYNIAIGPHAAGNRSTDSYNIDIGDATGSYEDDVAGESTTIRIGETKTHTATYIAGIYGQTAQYGAKTVYIDSTGRLGTAIAGEGCRVTRLLIRNPRYAGSHLEPPEQQQTIAAAQRRTGIQRQED